MTISAADATGNRQPVAESSFTVEKNTWIQLTPNNMRDNYSSALQFFGSEEKFLFRFYFSEGKRIKVDPKWTKLYAAKAKGLNGHAWSVHTDAVQYFDKACDYLENTYVRVHGKNGDSGIILLKNFVTMDGTMVRRFTRDKQFISHHSFGTAVDINAHTESNSNKLKNRELIYRDVTDNLVYNGIMESDGKTYYDFTYSGSSRQLKKRSRNG